MVKLIKYNITIYGDSLPPYELITVKKEDLNRSLLYQDVGGKDVKVETFANSLDIPWQEYRGFKIGDITVNNKEYKDLSSTNYMTYTHEGYKPIKKIIRHNTNKKLYKIRAVDKNGNIRQVIVTEGHSLILKDGNLVEAQYLMKGDLLCDYL